MSREAFTDLRASKDNTDGSKGISRFSESSTRSTASGKGKDSKAFKKERRSSTLSGISARKQKCKEIAAHRNTSNSILFIALLKIALGIAPAKKTLLERVIRDAEEDEEEEEEDEAEGDEEEDEEDEVEVMVAVLVASARSSTEAWTTGFAALDSSGREGTEIVSPSSF